MSAAHPSVANASTGEGFSYEGTEVSASTPRVSIPRRT